jgi:hypothetical protein
MVNPFDRKTVFLAKHAQHVVLSHFPIALFITSVAFDLIAQWTKRRGLADAAYYNLLVAAISTIPVIATGLLAWRFQLEGQKLKGILLMHLVLAYVSTVNDMAGLVGAFPRAPAGRGFAKLPSGVCAMRWCPFQSAVGLLVIPFCTVTVGRGKSAGDIIPACDNLCGM